MANLLSINNVIKSFITKRGIVLSLSLIFSMGVYSQNLVLNPSFEDYNQCPDVLDCDIANIPHWQWSYSMLSYLNICHFSDSEAVSCAAPFHTTDGGCFQYPQHGDGYALVESSIYPVFSYRNQIQTKLLHPLDSGQCYYFSMYINLCDSCLVATDDIGVLFRKNFININTGPNNPVYNFPTPQIIHKGTFITEKTEWVKYEGTFKADGNEEYMLIGSFSYPDSINMIVLDNGSQFSNKSSYLVDNIMLIECDSVTGIDEFKPEIFNVYPNPAQDFVSIELPKNYNQSELNIYNLTGQLISQKNITQSGQQIPITELGNGMYIFVIESGDKVIGRQRVVVAR